MKATSAIKVHLKEDDVLFFMHIGRTGGTSLISILDAQFPHHEIFPLHSAPWYQTEELFARFSPEELAGYRLVRGHFQHGPLDNGVYKYIARNSIRITMLRDPVDRTISEYRHLQRGPQVDIQVGKITHHAGDQESPPTPDEDIYDEARNMSLKEFVCHPRFFGYVVNRQTREVAGAIKGKPRGENDPDAMPDHALLGIAKEQLDQFAFVGLTERYRQSLQLLTYTFSWPPVNNIPLLNTAPRPLRRTEIASDTLDAILERTQLDAELYNYAERRFETDYAQMVDELLTVESSFHASGSWRMAHQNRSFREKFAPNGSARKRVLKWLASRVFGK